SGGVIFFIIFITPTLLIPSLRRRNNCPLEGTLGVSINLKQKTMQNTLHKKTKLLLLLLFPLWGLGGYAQPYEWDWTINGGSDTGSGNSWRYNAEQAYDIVVGSDDNYYFLASINRSSLGLDSQLAGQPVTVYNSYDTSALDIFLFSTTCEGTVRWSQAIGGGDRKSTR